MTEQTFVKRRRCPHCGKTVDVVVKSDMRYGMRVKLVKQKEA